MIELINVCKYYHTDIGRHYVLRDVSLRIPRDINVAIIGANGSGKSTTLRLIAGVDTPNSGKIIRTGRISWPMGLTPGVQQSLNGYENARFACRIYGMPNGEIRNTIEKVRSIADIGKYFDLPVNTYSAGMRQRLSFAISISLDFDYYLFDEIGAGGDRRFRKLARELIHKRLSSSNFIMVSHAPSDVLDLCQAAVLLRDGAATYFEDVREALSEYGEAEAIEKFDRRNETMANQRAGRRAGKRGAGGRSAAAEDISESDASAKPRRKRRARRKKVRAKRQARRISAKSNAAAVKQARKLKISQPTDELPAKALPAALPESGKPRARKQAEKRRARRRLRKLASPAGRAADAPGIALPHAAKKSSGRSKRKRLRSGQTTAAGASNRLRPAEKRKRRMSRRSVAAVPKTAAVKGRLGADTAPHAAAHKINALAESWSARSKTQGQLPFKRDLAE